jgi:hypothetical protein
MVDILDDDDFEPVELQPRHRRRLTLLATVTNLGLLLICVSAVWTAQPATFGLRRWAGLGLFALILLTAAAVSRGRSAFTTSGKLATALAAIIVLGLSYDPQLSNIGTLGETMPSWLLGVAPGLGTLGVIITAIFGLTYDATINNYQRHRHDVPFAWGLKVATLLVIVLGLASYLCLHRMYELDSTVLGQLLGNAIQYYFLALVVVSLCGRIAVGSTMQVMLSATILLALVRNILAAHGQ